MFLRGIVPVYDGLVALEWRLWVGGSWCAALAKGAVAVFVWLYSCAWLAQAGILRRGGCGWGAAGDWMCLDGFYCLIVARCMWLPVCSLMVVAGRL